MPDKPIASVDISAETAKYLHEMVDSLQKIQEAVEFTGNMGDRILGYMREMPNMQQTMLTTMQQSLAVDQQLLTSSTQRHTLLKSMTDLKKQGLDYDKEGLDTEEKRRLSESRKAAGQLMHPGAMLEEKGLGMLGSGPQIAAIIGIAALSATAEAVSKMRSITRTGGEGMMGGGMGAENAMSIESSMRWAALSIPFFKEKYASTEQLTAGAATMYGQGGIRGGDLAEVMEFLPKAAHEAGMSFQDASNIMAKANRVFVQSPIELKMGFELVTEAAKEAGYKVSDFTKFVYDTSFKLAQYGETEESVTDATKELYETTLKGKMSLEEFQKQIVEGRIKGEKSAETAERLLRANKESEVVHVGLMDLLNLRSAIEKTLAGKSLTFVDAIDKAGTIAFDYAKALTLGKISQEEITAANDVLVEHFGKTSGEATDFAAKLTQAAREVGGSGPELVKFGLDLAQTFKKITHNSEESSKVGGAVAAHYAKNLTDLDVSTQNLNKIFSFTTEKLHMSGAASMALTDHFITLGKETKIQTSSIVGWYEQLTSGMMAYFKDPKEASKMAGMALDSTVNMLNSGKISVSDYTQIMKTQMDVFGQSSSTSMLQFNTLAEVVKKTGVRMEELASQTAELAKINRQYGFDQQVSNSLLVMFNEGLRSGSMSMGDVQAVMRGAGGAGEGVRAMVASRLMQQGMFQGMNIGAAVDIGLPDLMRTHEDASGSDVQKWRGKRLEANKTFRDVANELIKSAGGDTGAEENQIWAFKKLAKDITGSDVNAYGKDLKNIMEMVKTGDFIGAIKKATDVQKDDPDNPQKMFKSSVNKQVEGQTQFVFGMEKVQRGFESMLGRFWGGKSGERSEYVTLPTDKRARTNLLKQQAEVKKLTEQRAVTTGMGTNE